MTNHTTSIFQGKRSRVVILVVSELHATCGVQSFTETEAL